MNESWNSESLLQVCRSPNLSAQHGNAMVEFFILTLVMVPLLVSLPLLGKISDANQALVQASRYGAFETTVAKPNTAAISQAIKQRFYAAPEQAITSDARVDAGSINNYWQMTASSGDSDHLLKPSSPLKVSSRHQPITDNTVASLSSAIISAGNVLTSISHDTQWDLEKKGLYTISLEAAMTKPHMIDDNSQCGNYKDTMSCIVRSTTILVDEWTSGSVDTAEDRSRALVPAGVFRPVGKVLAKIGEIPLLEELKGLDDAFGKVDAGQVPGDRLGPWLEAGE